MSSAIQLGLNASRDDVLPRRRPDLSRITAEKSRCVHRWFEAQAAKRPGAIALATAEETLTYRELNARANRLAHRLRGMAVGPEVLVGLCAGRSAGLVVGLLAVLKAGGAYVPLDPSYPADRLAYMLGDSGIAALLAERAILQRLPAAGVPTECIDPERDEIEPGDEAELAGGPSGDNLAYVIYTSGSTGRPKGVQVTHVALANLLQSMRNFLGITERDALLAVTTMSFDIAALEVLLPLIVGARVELVDRDVAADGVRLAERLADPGITFLQATPATWRMLLEAGWSGKPGLTMLCGGEAFPRSLADRLLGRGAALWNVYGPTETTIWSTAGRVEPGEGPITIGRPVANTRLYVLDRWLRPVPVGVSGELYIGGMGLAREYLHRPGLTAERFIPDPFGPVPGGRLYRTGDVARWRPDGTIECQGRVDHQVKIRGFRVEPGELEATLVQHPSVREAVVVARADHSGESALIAYVVPRQGPELATADELRQWMMNRLPDYMIPSAFVPLAELPLTPNGKIDRAALPDPAPIRPHHSDSDVPPRGPIEEAVASIYAELLGAQRVGGRGNFFELGGHSLLAIQLLARVRRTFDVEVPLRAFIDDATVAGLSRRIESALARGEAARISPIERVDRNGPLPASFAQQRLWLLDRIDPGSAAYNIPVALRIVGELDVVALERALNEVVRRHEVLRTAFESRGDVPFQVIAPELKLTFEVDDLAELPEPERHAELARRVREEASRPFDLARGPLIRAGLLRLGEREHVAQVTMHHIVSDGWSLGVLLREASALYGAYREGRPSPLPEPAVQYTDYAAWERGWLAGEELDRQLEYWKVRLAGLPMLELPTDRPHAEAPGPRGGEQSAVVSGDVLEGLRRLCREEGATLYMGLLSGLFVLLHRYGGQEDVAIGTPVAGRGRPELEGLIGLFVNTLVMRGDLSGGPGFREVVRRVRRGALEAYAHQDVPYERLVAAARSGRGELFRVMFAMQDAPLPALRSPDLVLEPLEATTGTAKFDLTFFAAEGEGELKLSLEYSADLFEGATAERMLAHYTALLGAAAAEPDRPITSLSMLTQEERKQLLGQCGPAEIDGFSSELEGLGEEDLDSLLEEFSVDGAASDEVATLTRQEGEHHPC
jgi:amino acid adenylation domain-containing protein